MLKGGRILVFGKCNSVDCISNLFAVSTRRGIQYLSRDHFSIWYCWRLKMCQPWKQWGVPSSHFWSSGIQGRSCACLLVLSCLMSSTSLLPTSCCRLSWSWSWRHWPSLHSCTAPSNSTLGFKLGAANVMLARTRDSKSTFIARLKAERRLMEKMAWTLLSEFWVTSWWNLWRVLGSVTSGRWALETTNYPFFGDWKVLHVNRSSFCKIFAWFWGL